MAARCWRRFRTAVLLLASASGAAAQSSVPQGAFVGHFRSSLNSTAVQLVDVRLFFVDSTRDVTTPGGETMVDTFVDTTRSRIAATDSTGYFAIWRLKPGRYLMQSRRIGFEPIQAVVAIDSETVLHDFTMAPIAALLNKVEIREVSATSLSKRLDHVGFLKRMKFKGEQGDYVLASDFARYKPQTLRDILSRYGIFSSHADFVMDGMSLDYWDIQDYPAVLVAGIEIYRRNRPSELNRTRTGPSVLSPGGNAFVGQPLVVIWTHIP
jgi:hypothetical protein